MQARPAAKPSDCCAPSDGAGDNARLTQKVWGESRELYRDDDVEVVRIVVRRGGHSSRHRHLHKANAFLVVQGRLRLLCYDEYAQSDCVLTPDDGLYAVAPGVDHRFVAIEENTVAYEFYYAVGKQVINPRDIVRTDQGGIMQDHYIDSDF